VTVGATKAPARLVGLPPVIRRDAVLAILGSFPGEASLAAQQYYGHPRNQFWPLLGRCLDVDLPSLPYRERLRALREHRIALWDVYAACRREGSLDSAIEAAEPNDLYVLTWRAPGLHAVAHNGGESARAMRITAALGLQVHRLPSSSPAHASWSFERKLDAWRAVLRAYGLAR
jgi:hypoxanthine-DNA glycosylase